jgi:Transglutaminase-like superfamily
MAPFSEEAFPVPRTATLVVALLLAFWPAAFGQRAEVEQRMAYTPSHRATFEQQWKYTFPKHKSRRWFIALRYPPELAWSRDAVGKAELRTSSGWKPFREVFDGSKERRRMLIIDYAHDDPMLRKGFVLRTTLTATISDQQLERGSSARAVPPLLPPAREKWLEHTSTYNFRAPQVKKWMDSHQMWKKKDESTLNFVHRVYKQLRVHMPYSTRDGGPWVCSQILKVGFGECCRHSIVTTSILRANKIPARTVCGLWAIDNKSTGGHCWGEFFLEGAGWVPYDTTLGDDKQSEAYFGTKKGEVLAGMVDFDWVIEAGPFGRQTVQAIDASPAFWSQGEGPMDDPKTETHTSVHVIKRFRG